MTDRTALPTETLDKLYLEWSQFTRARTAREIEMETALEAIAGHDGMTLLCPDDAMPGEVQNAYSWGVSDGYKNIAEFARATLSRINKALGRE